MKALLILGAVFFGLLLFSQVRVGGTVVYAEQGLQILIRIGPLRIRVFPVKKKKERPSGPGTGAKPERKHKADADAVPEPKDTLELVRQFLPLAADAAGSLQKRIRVDDLDLTLTMAASDPAMAAAAFGGANAILGMVIPLLENNFNIRERKIRTAVDFDRHSRSLPFGRRFRSPLGKGSPLPSILDCGHWAF